MGKAKKLSDDNNTDTPETATPSSEETDGTNVTDEGMTPYDDLMSQHAEALSIATAKIATVESERDAALAEIERLKAKNWDLVEIIPQDGDTPEAENQNEVNDGIDALFDYPDND